jgi:uncharacterized membrane protein YphA (DoxX/SURF4 family)
MAGTKEHPLPAGVPHDPYGHGHSVAAWTAVTLVMIGALLMSVAVALGFKATWLFAVGVGVVVLGGLLGKVLGAMGFGSKGRSTR